jgi:(2Fe-2S) ferredoxin
MAIKDLQKVRKHVLLCNGGTCKKSGAEQITDAIRASILEQGLSDEIHTTKTLCNGRCNDGPIVIVMPDCIWLQKMSLDQVDDFVLHTLKEGQIPEEQCLFKLAF